MKRFRMQLANALDLPWTSHGVTELVELACAELRRLAGKQAEPEAYVLELDDMRIEMLPGGKIDIRVQGGDPFVAGKTKRAIDAINELMLGSELIPATPEGLQLVANAIRKTWAEDAESESRRSADGLDTEEGKP